MCFFLYINEILVAHNVCPEISNSLPLHYQFIKLSPGRVRSSSSEIRLSYKNDKTTKQWLGTNFTNLLYHGLVSCDVSDIAIRGCC